MIYEVNGGRWVHVKCDPELTEEEYKKYEEDENAKFVCGLCEDRKLSMILNRRKRADPEYTFKIFMAQEKRNVAPPAIIN
jgi:hypothetical protein